MKYQKGHIGYWLGKTSVNRKGVYKKCLGCNKQIYVAPWQEKIGEGKYCSKKCYSKIPISVEHRKKLSETHMGLKSPNWLGGITKKYFKRLNNYTWRLIKHSVFIRDNYTCQICMKKIEKGKLDCHHIIPYRIGINKDFVFFDVKVNDMGNLVSLCKSCHVKTDREFRRLEKKGEYYGIPTILHKVSTV
jgi:hypothetical protein